MSNDPSAIDPGGRHVILHDDTIEHLRSRRPEMLVVDFNESPAFVVTAFVQDNEPGAKP